VFLKYIGGFIPPDMRTPEQVEADRIAEEKLAANRVYHREKTRQWNERRKAKIAAEAAEAMEADDADAMPKPAA
jgi:hypothetical protein